MINLPNFLIIGAYSRNAGKTGFARQVIKQMNGNITALKVTVIKNEQFNCPRGGRSCGVCSSLESDFEISEEHNKNTGKDTSELLRAGAKRVLWLRVRENAVTKGMEELLKQIEILQPVICESNSIMKSVTPSLFFLLQAKSEQIKKKTALVVEDRADLIIRTDAESSNFDFSRLNFKNSQWVLT
ncbi:MAG: hypothetical protein JEY91_02535 [Spirochaetaceae bacterium]|nr:hypothetical protein [Spirochaetaceae bacterium]